MPRKQKTESQREQDKKGAERMKRYEEDHSVVVEEVPVIKIIESVGDYEDYIVVAYQKKDPGEWERKEITYSRKKKGH
jgi:hypothetical protein